MTDYETSVNSNNAFIPGYGENWGFKASKIGIPTSIQTANQLQETTNALNQGTKFVELQPIQQETFQQIPKQHFKEIYRLSKLVGSETSLHAPMIEPSGIGEQGWSKESQDLAMRQLYDAVEKAHELNPNKPVSVTIHGSGLQGNETVKDSSQKDGYRITAIPVLDQATGRFKGVIPEDEEWDVETNTLKKVNPFDKLKEINKRQWQQEVRNAIFYKNKADDLISSELQNELRLKEIEKTDKLNEEQKKMLKEQIKESSQEQKEEGKIMFREVELNIKNMYDTAKRYSSDEEKEKLREVHKLWSKSDMKDLNEKSRVFSKSLQILGEISPETLIPLQEFAKDKTAETFANIALEASKMKGAPPQINIENLYTGMGFSNAKEMKTLVDTAREKFVEKAVKNENMSEEEARKKAKEIIGVTWDVGHSNIMRKQGFGKADVIKEAAAIASYVKHVHLTDNFGYTDSHLAAGMGNVPIKEIFGKLKEAGFKGNVAHEAGAFAVGFKTSPHTYALEALGSPLYPSQGSYLWGNQKVNGMGQYFGGYGTMIPEGNFARYGAGFSNMPVELGGQKAKSQGQFSGNPTE